MPSRHSVGYEAPGARRRHAVKVAAAATVIAAVVAFLAGTALDMLVLHRLHVEGDARLLQRLDTAVNIQHLTPARPPSAALPSDGDGDIDDAPAVVWVVQADGSSTPATSTRVILPVRTWHPGRVEMLGVGNQHLAFVSQRVDGGWVVVGQSTATIDRVRTDLIVVELLVGAVLLGVTYLGAIAVGLRVSAPVEEIRRRQADFTADASHELRTPLSVIQAEVGLALGRDRSEAYYRDTLRRVAEESDRLRSIVDDLLWLARTDAHNDRPPDRVVDVTDVALATVSRFAAVAAGRGVDLEWPGGAPASVKAPPGWVDRLAAVLVDNACRYVGAGGHIRVSVVARGHHVTLAVDDDGPGVPVEQRPLLLDRFHRATDAAGGTGLGLAIADSVVRATAGHWTIGDSPLGGARFAVTWRSVGAPSSQEPAMAPR